jgi:hypothetical protein
MVPSDGQLLNRIKMGLFVDVSLGGWYMLARLWLTARDWYRCR